MTKYRNSSASISTSTHNREEIEAPTENIYEALSIIAKRSNQINLDIRNRIIHFLLSVVIVYTSEFDLVMNVTFLSFLRRFAFIYLYL